MKLKQQLNLEEFFEKVRLCRGEVTFHSEENDILNLKSRLCLYLFTASCSMNDALPAGHLQCQHPEDERLLAEFMEDEQE